MERRHARYDDTDVFCHCQHRRKMAGALPRFSRHEAFGSWSDSLPSLPYDRGHKSRELLGRAAHAATTFPHESIAKPVGCSLFSSKKKTVDVIRSFDRHY
jgi:hypothetical protein